MKTLLFCTSYMNNNSALHHMNRYKRWTGYYLPLLKELGADRIFLIDDGGSDCLHASMNVIQGELPPKLDEVVNIYRFGNNLGRQSLTDHPGWWRSFLFSNEIAIKYGYDKLIHVESDFFLLSDRLKSYIRDLRTGWSSLFSHYHNFPETAVQVICSDAYAAFSQLKQRLEQNNYQTADFAERIIPFTNVEKRFIGDRLGESHVLDHWLDHQVADFSKLDYMGQMLTRHETNQ